MYKSTKVAERLGIAQAPAVALVNNRQVCCRSKEPNVDIGSVEAEIAAACPE